MTEPASAGGAAISEQGRGRWLGLAMLSLGVSMIIIDTTIVNVAVPSIIRDLKIDSTTAEWINTVYALVFAALLGLGRAFALELENDALAGLALAPTERGWIFLGKWAANVAILAVVAGVLILLRR